MYPDRFAVMTALSYITGAHNIKVGVQDTWGPYQRFRSANGDLRANFQNGRAFQAVILNTPVRFTDNLHADVGIYGQDSWTMNRLTLNYGARWEYFSSGTSEATATPGRFTSQRTFPAIEMPTWKSFSPRFGAVYDLFGNQKTALKVSIGKYMQAGTTGFSEAYNPLALTTANVAWTDVNGDGVPQGELGCNYGTAGTAGCELNLAQLPTGFGVANITNFDPDIERMYNIEWSASVQHELMPRVSVTAGWFHRDYKNLFRRRNTLQTFADYTPFTMWSPIDGSAITYYNVSAAKRTGDLDDRRERARSPDVVQRPRIQLQRAAAARHHAVRRRHDGAHDRPGLRRDREPEPAALLRPDPERHPVAHPVQDLGIGADEVRHPGQLRVPGPARLPSWHSGPIRTHRHLGPERYDEQQSRRMASARSGRSRRPPATRSARATRRRRAAWSAALVDPGMTVASLNVPLVAPNTEYGDRINQLDLSISKTIRHGRASFQPKIDFFNLLNVSPVIDVRNSATGMLFGTASYMQPSSVLVGRVFQLGAIVKF